MALNNAKMKTSEMCSEIYLRQTIAGGIRG